MSGIQTHMLIGMAGGLALTQVLRVPVVCETMDLCAPAGPPGILRDAGVVVASAFLASWPDIDEPNSFISRRVRWTTSIVVGLLLALAGTQVSNPIFALPNSIPPILHSAIYGLLGFIIGLALLGPWLGQMLLTTIRESAGGHRRLTHSLLISIPLLLISSGLWWFGLTIPAIILSAIAWGQILHLIGDVVTPAGVPLFWPLFKQDFHALPRPLATIGEPLAAVAAVSSIALIVLVRGWWQ
jgi:membrane-bound metal-dependent hydrolase YbcI (DUF457 family)